MNRHNVYDAGAAIDVVSNLKGAFTVDHAKNIVTIKWSAGIVILEFGATVFVWIVIQFPDSFREGVGPNPPIVG